MKEDIIHINSLVSANLPICILTAAFGEMVDSLRNGMGKVWTLEGDVKRLGFGKGRGKGWEGINILFHISKAMAFIHKYVCLYECLGSVDEKL